MVRLGIVDHEVFTGEDQPEGEQAGVEDTLANVLEQWHHRQVEVESEDFNGHIQKCQCTADREQHVLQQYRFAVLLVYPVPEPVHSENDQREKCALQGPPHFGKAAILVDANQHQVSQVAKVGVHPEAQIQ